MSISPVLLQVNQAKGLVKLSDVIRARRNELGYTQEKVAFEIDCDPATYNRWENNPDGVRFADMQKLAVILKTSLVAMIRSVEEKNADVVHEPMETYGLRAKVAAQEEQIELYKDLLRSKDELLEKYREKEPKKGRRKA